MVKDFQVWFIESNRPMAIWYTRGFFSGVTTMCNSQNTMVAWVNPLLCGYGTEIRNRPDNSATQESLSSVISEKAIETRKLDDIHDVQCKVGEHRMGMLCSAQLVLENKKKNLDIRFNRYILIMM